MGAAPVRPPIPGYDVSVPFAPSRMLPGLPADVEVAPATAVVIGAGFIGLEMAENLVAKGNRRHRCRGDPQVLPPLDPELAILVARRAHRPWCPGRDGLTVASVEDTTVTLGDGRVLPADLVVGAIGVRPDVRLAELACLELGPNGGIAVNEANQTNDPDVYAVGDAVEKPDAISHAYVSDSTRQRRQPSGSPCRGPHCRASLTSGRLPRDRHREGLRPGSRDGRLEREGACGPPASPSAHPLPPVRPCDLLSGRNRMATKLIFDPYDGTILGAQIVGRNGVDKRIDVIATAMAAEMMRDTPRRPRARLRAALLLGQGSGQPARLHGGERPERRLRRRRRQASWRTLEARLVSRRRAQREEHAAGAIPDRSTSRSTRYEIT